MRKVTLIDWERYPYQTEKGTYIKQENVLISDWERKLHQTEKGTYIRLGKVPLSGEKGKLTISDRERYLYQTEKGTYYLHQTRKGTYIWQGNVPISGIRERYLIDQCCNKSSLDNSSSKKKTALDQFFSFDVRIIKTTSKTSWNTITIWPQKPPEIQSEYDPKKG